MREGQVGTLVELCQEWAQEDNDLPLIITGDFNDTPDSMALQKMYNCDLIETVSGKQEHEPEFTTHKYRDTTGLQTRTIDYMFYK